MKKRLRPQDIDVVILSGGQGKRLQGIVSDRPKPMAIVNGRPFMDILIGYVLSFGFKRFILCTGYMAHAIRQHYKNREDCTVLFSHENTPLGTAGAIKNAEGLIRSNIFLAMNGDSICRLDIKDFLDCHISKKAMASVALCASSRDKDYGAVSLSRNSRIVGFDEKTAPSEGRPVNAGVYAFKRDVLRLMPPCRNYSLEYDLFPSILRKRIYGYITDAGFIDIGTPERYKKTEDFLRSW